MLKNTLLIVEGAKVFSQTEAFLKSNPFANLRPSRDWPAYDVPAEKLIEFCNYLKYEAGYAVLADVTAIDWGQKSSPRFTAIYHFYSPIQKTFLRVASNCVGDENPKIQSLTSLWPSADWNERETYDMFGIVFEGHPDLRRILMWEDYPYHPLRKEFPLAGIPTDLPDETIAKETGAHVIAAPMMGGPFHAGQGCHMGETEPRAKDESWTENQEKPIHDHHGQFVNKN